MAHHYDGYQVSTSWGSDSVRTVAAIRQAITIIENLEDSNSIVNQEILSGLRLALDNIRDNARKSYKGEF
tara:strand:+ start:61 stop:270 length:210 start_codon:yes stop_codon:yes gene_type:complete